uniref:Uncharacterized protein n=1 Tax=Rangifer tarandus platyrhynchus TaxID=3082113 RepID=A0ACB0EXU9_RANTA|nr:unnamed protein product [Rangifer tarandus platyrhynchus]
MESGGAETRVPGVRPATIVPLVGGYTWQELDALRPCGPDGGKARFPRWRPVILAKSLWPTAVRKIGLTASTLLRLVSGHPAPCFHATRYRGPGPAQDDVRLLERTQVELWAET